MGVVQQRDQLIAASAWNALCSSSALRVVAASRQIDLTAKSKLAAFGETNMGLSRMILDVPTSEDGRTTFSDIADILDHLATVYAWHADVHAFLLIRAQDAREADRVYSESEEEQWKSP